MGSTVPSVLFMAFAFGLLVGMILAATGVYLGFGPSFTITYHRGDEERELHVPMMVILAVIAAVGALAMFLLSTIF